MYDVISYTGELINFSEYSYTNVNHFNINDTYLFEEDVIDENDFIDSTIEDILDLLPKELHQSYILNMKYDKEFNRWKVGYSYEGNDHYIYDEFEKDLHKALIKLYNRIKDLDNGKNEF